MKATGFDRIDFDPSEAIKLFHQANSDSLLFGTDLPSKRAPTPFQLNDIQIILESLSHEAAKKVLRDNAIEFYKKSLLELPLIGPKITHKLVGTDQDLEKTYNAVLDIVKRYSENPEILRFFARVSRG